MAHRLTIGSNPPVSRRLQRSKPTPRLRFPSHCDPRPRPNRAVMPRSGRRALTAGDSNPAHGMRHTRNPCARRWQPARHPMRRHRAPQTASALWHIAVSGIFLDRLEDFSSDTGFCRIANLKARIVCIMSRWYDAYVLQRSLEGNSSPAYGRRAMGRGRGI